MFGTRLRQHSQLVLTEVSKRYDDHTVLDRVDLTISPGERVGVIGDNGSGKSTLLRLLAGEEVPDNGDLTVRTCDGVGYLPQTLEQVSGGVLTGTVGDAIDAALRVLRELEARLRTAEAGLGDATAEELDAYGDLLAEFEARDGYNADARVSAGLHGLGLPDLERDRPLRSLSGGERSRLALAAMLAASPELLLLDEPTNDLDDRAVTWLEGRLRRHRGTVVAVTHDRAFLAGVTDTVLEVDRETRRITRYGNGYDGFLAAKAAARARWVREYEDWKLDLARQRKLAENNVAAMEAIPRKMVKAAFGHGAFKMRGANHGAMGRVRNAKERMRRLNENPVAPPPVPLQMTAEFTGPRTEAGPEPVVELERVRVEHRLDVPALAVAPGERVLLTGPNGAGKTTLLRVMAEDLAPDSGKTIRPGSGRTGFLRQENAAAPAGQTVLQAYAAGRPGSSEDYRDRFAATGLFRLHELDQAVASLSVGQRRRIEVARLASGAYDLLLLDEPSNHLSPGLLEQLEEALSRYAGAVVLVTHDRMARDRFVGRRLELREGTVVGDRS